MTPQKKRLIVSVSNDLYSDQRVHKTCCTLTNMGFEVLVLGRCYRDSPELESRPYRTKRFKLCFRKGSLFYAELNLRLFLYLLFKSSEVLWANDLDTLLPNVLVSKIKRKPLIYDSHEYFCGVPELIKRPEIQNIWKRIERFCLPKIETMFTVNQSIADLYREEYGKTIHILRNIPYRQTFCKSKTRLDLGLPEDLKILVIQGAGINKDRGAEDIVEIMPHLKDVFLMFCGSGDVIPFLKQRVWELKLEEQVRFFPRMPYADLMQYVALADFGLILDKPTCINQKFSLPNKLFDDIQAGIPVIVSDLPEIAHIVKTYRIGYVLKTLTADALQTCLSDETAYRTFQQNLPKAAQELCWENEETVLTQVLKRYL